MSDLGADSPVAHLSGRMLEPHLVWSPETGSTDAHEGDAIISGGSNEAMSLSTASTPDAAPVKTKPAATPKSKKASALLSTPAQSAEHRLLVQSSDESGLHSSDMHSPATSSPLPPPVVHCIEGEKEEAAAAGAKVQASGAPEPNNAGDSRASYTMATPLESCSADLEVVPRNNNTTEKIAILPACSGNSSAADLTALCSTRADSLGTGGLRRGYSDIFSQDGSSEKHLVMRRHTAVVLLPTSSTEDEGPEAPPVRRAKSVQRRLSGVYEGHHVPLQKLRQQMGETHGKKYYTSVA